MIIKILYIYIYIYITFRNLFSCYVYMLGYLLVTPVFFPLYHGLVGLHLLPECRVRVAPPHACSILDKKTCRQFETEPDTMQSELRTDNRKFQNNLSKRNVSMAHVTSFVTINLNFFRL